MQYAQGPLATFTPQSTQGTVLCCLCGCNITPNPSNMCVSCLRSQVDITEGLQKQVTILWCKDCGRYLQPPKHWVAAELESKELLTFCIKKIKGLNKVKLVDAGFIWTEPHSKRLKVKLTVQAEVFNGAILQQTFVVEYVVEYNMCMDCNRANANPNSWIACVQLRQHVFHKRTFFFLEQLILKHGADASCLKVRDVHEGVDFFFATRGHALKFIDFLQNVVPIRYRHDKQLVSHDTHNNTYNYKFTFSVEIIPLCKDDLICLPHKLVTSLGNFGPIVVAARITNQLTMIDPLTLRVQSMDAPVYYRMPFGSLANSKQLTQYIVLDIEPLGQTNGKWAMAEAQVARVQDFGRNDTVLYTRTHLGNILHPGDMALGYDTANAQLVGIDYEAYAAKGGQLPDCILVKKSYEEKRRKRREKRGIQRPWKLKTLNMEVDETGPGAAKRAADTEEVERERFLEELEEDADMRQRINLFKDTEAIAIMAQRAAATSGQPRGLDEMGDESSDDDDLPEVPLDELLDDLEGLGIHEDDDQEEQQQQQQQGPDAGSTVNGANDTNMDVDMIIDN